MLKARNISFFMIMRAGYISASTYRALNPKTQLYQLTFSDCYNYESVVCEELKKIFEDDEFIENIGYLEYIETNIDRNFQDYVSILNYCIENVGNNIAGIIENIGEKVFLVDYLFCTENTLKQLYLINIDNISTILQVRYLYKQWLENYIEKGSLPVIQESVNYYDTIVEDEPVIVSEPFGNYTITSGNGFYGKDSIIIEDDALGNGNESSKKYILYLFSLSFNEFEIFESFLQNIISSCSVRTSNCIRAIGFRCFVVNYLFANESKWFQIRNFGKKSMSELLSIKPLIIDFVISQYEKANTDIVEKELEQEIKAIAFEELTLREKVGDQQYSLLYKELTSLLPKVSVRTQNGIKNYKGDFLEDFVNKSNDITSLKHIGKKSVQEFDYIISHLRDMIKRMTVREFSSEEIFWYNVSEIYGPCIDEYCHSYYKEQNALPMFHILWNSIIGLVEKRNFKILNCVIPFFKGSKSKSLEIVSDENGLTRERVRQICVKAINALMTLDEDELNLYALNILKYSDNWQYVKEKLIRKPLWESNELNEVIDQEYSQLTDNFLTCVLSLVFSNDFRLFGKMPLSISSKKEKWSNSYLIKKEVMDAFNFDVMAEIIQEYEDSNSESTTLSIDELLNDTFYSAWKNYDYKLVDDISQVVSEILIEEFSIIPDLDNKFTLVGMKEESTEDVLYDILKSVGDPIGIDELFSLFESKYPNRYKSKNSLRSVIYRDMRICLVGMSNQVALTEWTHIQTGSIRDLIVEYLASNTNPQHIKNIVTHIIAIRDTSERSIYATMTCGDQFVRFPGGYFGLADKTYSEWFSLSEAERFARDKIVKLEEFLKENGRFPFCPSDNKDEEALYQWWSRVKRQTDFTDEFMDSVKRIEEAYSELPHNKSELLWSKKCSEYEKFLRTYGRKPSEKFKSEANLSKWFDKALDDIAEGKLSSIKESLFIKLCHSL